jgi:hypothetical protein
MYTTPPEHIGLVFLSQFDDSCEIGHMMDVVAVTTHTCMK